MRRKFLSRFETNKFRMNQTINASPKAMVFEKANSSFKKIEPQKPVLNEGEILIKIEYTTICSSDLHTFFGRRNSPAPSVLGHEIMGTIADYNGEELFDFNGEKLEIGDTVTWLVYSYDACCKESLKGYPQKSESLYKYGHERITKEHILNGGFANYCHLKKDTHLYKLPANLPYKTLAPVNCTHATIAAAIRLAGNYFTNKNVLVVGAGMLGLSAAAMSKENNAAKVICLDINAKRLKQSEKFGADITINTEGLDQEAVFEKVKSTIDIDVIIETSGIPDVISALIPSLNVGGQLILVGSTFSQPNTFFNAETVVRKLITIKGLHNYTPKDLAYAIDFLLKHGNKYPFEKLVSAEFDLEELYEAFKVADNGNHFRVGIVNNKSNQSTSDK